MIAQYLLFAIYIFLQLIYYIIWIDVISSWTHLLGFSLNLRFIKNITEPIYAPIRKHLPTTFGMVDFTPIFVIFGIGIIESIIINMYPEIMNLPF